MKIEFLNIDIDESPIETVNFRDKRFMHLALETGIDKSAVPHESMEFDADYKHGVITETVKFFQTVNQMAQQVATMAGAVVVFAFATLIFWGK